MKAIPTGGLDSKELRRRVNKKFPARKRTADKALFREEED